jgi:hypothetical protein
MAEIAATAAAALVAAAAAASVVVEADLAEGVGVAAAGADLVEADSVFCHSAIDEVWDRTVVRCEAVAERQL